MALIDTTWGLRRPYQWARNIRHEPNEDIMATNVQDALDEMRQAILANAFHGVEEAPMDGSIYARKTAHWFALYGSDEVPPGPGGQGDFTTNLGGAGSIAVPDGKTFMIGEAWGGGGSGSSYGASGAVFQGGGGGAYSRFQVAVTPGQVIYYFCGAGGGSNTWYDGIRGQDSWINPNANSKPTAPPGCVAGGGGGGGDTGAGGGGTGTIGSVNFNGGNCGTSTGSGGGGGAGSAGAGQDAVGHTGGAGGSPDGGAGGNGASVAGNGGLPGSMIGGGGGGSLGSVTIPGTAANGQIRISFS